MTQQSVASSKSNHKIQKAGNQRQCVSVARANSSDLNVKCSESRQRLIEEVKDLTAKNAEVLQKFT